ncbi:MAG: NUDIX domain-containing protein [Candidatus Sungbacteria bacterium]|nr:NUDIX domain-containing protein [Candidatus Sungbacteria bacterium]
MKRDYALYQVALKLLLRKGGRVLFLRISRRNFLDLPGGRIDNVENKIPLIKILAREIKEELGPSVKYKIGRPIFQFRRPVPSRGVLNFLTVYESKYISGSVKLSSEHESYEWINPKTHPFKRKDFMSHEEYKAFKAYFNF